MCPVQWVGTPISLCSSKTVTSAPSFAAVKAEKEPHGPAPTTVMSVCSFTCFTQHLLCLYLNNGV